MTDSVSRGDASAPWPLGPLGLRCRGSRPVVAVLGLARSGLAAARLLVERGCQVDLMDLRHPEPGTEVDSILKDLNEGGAELRIGPHDPDWLGRYDVVVKSPGVDRRIPFLQEATKRKIPVVGELEIASLLVSPDALIAITGTNGKSTTTAWIGEMLARDGRLVEMAGNIGRPLSAAVREHPEATFAVEVSSFQLEDVQTFRPKVAVLLNLTPDHLDRHQTMDAYRKAKLSLFSRQESDDIAVLGPDDDLAEHALAVTRARCHRFLAEDRGALGCFLRADELWLRDSGVEVPLQPRARLSLPGPHNLMNGMAAAAAAHAAGVSPSAISASLTGFPGLPHRLEPVGEIEGVRFINDSKATNVGSLAVALESFDQPVILIAGGQGKGQDFRPLQPLVQKSVATLILIGEDAKRLRSAWDVPDTRMADDLEEAVETARSDSRPGQVVLLSPGCASFDMFRDFEERGDRFRTLVQERRTLHG